MSTLGKVGACWPWGGGPARAGLRVLVAISALLGLSQPAAADEVTFEPRGRLQFDVLTSDWRTQADEGPHGAVRRLFLGGQGAFSGHWRYKAEFVLTPDADTLIDDAYLEYRNGPWSVLIGEHKTATVLEDQTSSLDLSFNEGASFVSAFGYGRRAGLGVSYGRAHWSAALAIQGDSLNALEGGETNADARTIAARATFAPLLRGEGDALELVHLGVNARRREFGDRPFRYRTRPMNGRGARWIDAGADALGERDGALGLEFAAQRGPIGVQAEHNWLSGDTAAGAGFEFSGYYVDVLWSPTGEARAYRAATGSFRAARPRRPVNEGGPGHWMLSVRRDVLDLSDPTGGSARGEQRATALGVDWIPVEHVRLKLNIARTEMDRSFGPDEVAEVVTARLQLDF